MVVPSGYGEGGQNATQPGQALNMSVSRASRRPRCILDSTCGELIGAQPFNANVHILYFSGKILSFKLNQIRSTSIAKRDVGVPRFVTNFRRGSIFKCTQAVLRAMAPPARRDRVGAGSLATPRPNQVHRRPQTPRHANATAHTSGERRVGQGGRQPMARDQTTK